MESLENSERSDASTLIGNGDVFDEVTMAKIEKLDRHGPIDDHENPPSKRVKPGSNEHVELSGPGPSTPLEDSQPRRERQKGIAPIKPESVFFRYLYVGILIVMKVSGAPVRPRRCGMRGDIS